jgi:Cof subfamily protein (haloacid dehalogenase superfamily)
MQFVNNISLNSRSFPLMPCIQQERANKAHILSNQTADCISFCSLEKTDTARPISELHGNFNNEIKIIFSDIDGTINHNHATPRSSEEAIRELNDAKIPVVLSTGKVYKHVSDIAKSLNIDSSYFITQHGAEIYDSKGTIIFQNTISPENAKSVIRCFNDAKKELHSDAKIILVFDGVRYAVEKFELAVFFKEMKFVNSFDELLDKDKKPTNIVIYDADKQIPEFYSLLKEQLPSDLNLVPLLQETCGIYNKTISKGSAIKKVSEILGIDLKNAAALGDADNDLPMMNTIRAEGGLTVAMGNSSENVIKASEFITAGVDKDGFKTAIDAILSNNRSLGEKQSDSKQGFLSWIKGLIFHS